MGVIINIFKLPELRRRVLFTVAMLAVYRFGIFVAIPGVDRAAMAKVVAGAAESGIPVPCFSSTLDYINSYRSGRLPQNLVQAMRDCFGSHTYQRVDKEGSFHTEWLS